MFAVIIAIIIVVEITFISLTSTFIKIPIFIQISTPFLSKSIDFVGKKIESCIWFRAILISKATFPGHGDWFRAGLMVPFGLMQ